MPYAAANPLLDDLQAELTAELIRTGNLKREREKPAFVPQWEFQGYVAIEELHSCKCGSGWISLRGVFSREKARTGEVRDTKLSPKGQIPLGRGWPIDTIEVPESVCPDCLPAHGFRR